MYFVQLHFVKMYAKKYVKKNSVHVTDSEIQPKQTFDTMAENNTPTALKGCGEKKESLKSLRLSHPMTNKKYVAPSGELGAT